MLSQPAAELSPSSGATVPSADRSRPRASSPGTSPFRSSRAASRSSTPARLQTLDTSSVKGSIAVVAGACGDLTTRPLLSTPPVPPRWWPIAGDGAECAGTVEQPAPLPAFQARPYDATRLLRLERPSPDRHPPRHEVHLRPDGLLARPGSAGATLDGSAQARRVVHRAVRLARRHIEGGSRVWDIRIGWVPGSRRRGVRSRPAGAGPEHGHALCEPDRRVGARRRGPQSPRASRSGARSASAARSSAGETVRDRWYGGPLATNASPLLAVYGWQAFAVPLGRLHVDVPADLDDDAGHVG